MKVQATPKKRNACHPTIVKTQPEAFIVMGKNTSILSVTGQFLVRNVIAAECRATSPIFEPAVTAATGRHVWPGRGQRAYVGQHGSRRVPVNARRSTSFCRRGGVGSAGQGSEWTDARAGRTPLLTRQHQVPPLVY